MSRSASSFRVGKVSAYLRGHIWYLCYYEHGQRRRPRVGSDKDVARQLAAQTNAQLELGGPAPLSFEPVTIEQLRDRWLHYHENVIRSSVATIRRYDAATRHFLNFIKTTSSAVLASHFRPSDAETFAAYLRRIEVPPNGHANSRKRPLRDKGVRYILEVCRGLFNYACPSRIFHPPCFPPRAGA